MVDLVLNPIQFHALQYRYPNGALKYYILKSKILYPIPKSTIVMFTLHINHISNITYYIISFVPTTA
jgi:hypothetical protein